jgi:hypothetical protein
MYEACVGPRHADPDEGGLRAPSSARSNERGRYRAPGLGRPSDSIGVADTVFLKDLAMTSKQIFDARMRLDFARWTSDAAMLDAAGLIIGAAMVRSWIAEARSICPNL